MRETRRTTEPVVAVPEQLEDALARACELLRNAQRVLLTSHRRPDGDGTGSMAGLASLLRALGKTAVIYSVDPIARRYRWLPLVNEEGRIVAPSWGRIQCWWANIAVTPHIKRKRLDKALMQVTAFWSQKLNLDLQITRFTVKMKEVRVPMTWEKDLRAYNIRQPWRDVGRIIWDERSARSGIPAIELEAL